MCIHLAATPECFTLLLDCNPLLLKHSILKMKFFHFNVVMSFLLGSKLIETFDAGFLKDMLSFIICRVF